ncbi:MAG: hypothetical protein IMY88_04635 [Chloroflexi bacterium]|nr:hypothetical protein [Chloroflexota bacterium]
MMKKGGKHSSTFYVTLSEVKGLKVINVILNRTRCNEESEILRYAQNDRRTEGFYFRNKYKALIAK